MPWPIPADCPGDGWDGANKLETDGEIKMAWRFFLANTRMARSRTVACANSPITNNWPIERLDRKSPTLGAKPPQGAVVLFDGTSAEKFQGGKMTPDGLLAAGATSRDKFRRLPIARRVSAALHAAGARTGPRQ